MEKTIRKRRTRLSRRLSKFRFFRVLNKDRGFAVVFLLLLAVVGLVVGGTLRWWSSSPAGHAGPVVRISGLDWLQAWSLRRSAHQLAREGKYDEALYTWRAAVARNLGDPELHRGILQHLQEASVPDPAHVVIVEASVQWLARLTRTNRMEIPLMAGVLERYTRPESGLAWADAQGGGSGVDDPVLRVRARCLLGAGQWEAFGRVWQGRPPGWDSDPELVLYGEAWRSATEEGAKGREAGERLRAAVNDSGRRGAVAARLLLYSAEKRSSVEDAQTAVARLVQLHGDTTLDHVRVWTLLAAAGRGEEARRLAREYRGTPLDAAGAARFVGTLLDLGLPREALDFLEAKIQGYGGSVEVWRAYFDALIKEARWSELRRACASARLLSGRQESLTGEVLFAELRAAVVAGRRGDAERVAPELALSTFATPARMLAAVSTLRESGYVEQAWSLLQRGRAAQHDEPGFWLEWFRVASLRVDQEGLRSSVSELTRLRPEDPAVEMVRAGWLLIAGEQEAEALRLTWAAYQRAPGQPAVRINHAFALVRNHRAEEAAEVLSAVDRARLPAELVSTFALAQAEVADARGRTEEVRDALSRVRDAELFPAQRERIGRIRERATSGVHAGSEPRR